MKVIYVESCENCPNVRKMAISAYCYLNGVQNPLPLDYKIPEWCLLDDYHKAEDDEIIPRHEIPS